MKKGKILERRSYRLRCLRNWALAALVLSLAVAAWFVFLGPAWLEERWESLRRKRLDRSRGGK